MSDLDDDKPRLKRGWARVRELDAQDAIDRQALEAELFTNLGRPPVAIDRVAIETLAASVIRARRLRAVGKSDAEERKTILQAIRATGIRPPPAMVAEQRHSDPFGLFIEDDADDAAAEDQGAS